MSVFQTAGPKYNQEIFSLATDEPRVSRRLMSVKWAAKEIGSIKKRLKSRCVRKKRKKKKTSTDVFLDFSVGIICLDREMVFFFKKASFKNGYIAV
jgi:hypothetical protein